MKHLIKDILARLLAVWAMVTFIITFLVFFIPSMLSWLIPEPAGQHVFILIARLWMNVWLPIVGCPVSVRGWNNFRKGQTYVVTCNHNSLMDVPISCPYIPGANKTIAKSSFAKIPLFGLYYTKGSVLVDRNSDESRRRSYEKMKSVLAKGMHMSVYPEGTRNRTDQPLKKFHDGAFRLAVESKHNIIPAIIFHTKKVLPPGRKFWFWPHRLEMHFLPEINVNGRTAADVREEVFRLMSEYYASRK
jgi:1-acyl-sn-glycerol-3-phosphate acyltransferase